jgi:hypothetical protein
LIDLVSPQYWAQAAEYFNNGQKKDNTAAQVNAQRAAYVEQAPADTCTCRDGCYLDATSTFSFIWDGLGYPRCPRDWYGTERES